MRFQCRENTAARFRGAQNWCDKRDDTTPQSNGAILSQLLSPASRAETANHHPRVRMLVADRGSSSVGLELEIPRDEVEGLLAGFSTGSV